MATWRTDLQRWSWAEGDTAPIRYCFVDPPTGGDHPRRAWSAAEKGAARHAIGEWNEALKAFARRNGRTGTDRVTEAAAGQRCDVTLRWEDSRFFRDYRVRDTATGKATHGIDLTGTPAYADRAGGGSLEPVRGNPLTPFTPGRDTARYPRGEIYFNTEPYASISDFKGWFVDPTPDRDEEFEAVESDTLPPYRKLQARRGGPADDRIDFYTAAKHEFGHMLGLGHRVKAGANGDRGQVMASGAGAQERRHQLPILKWMENERRHLTAGDIGLLEKHYRRELGPRRPPVWRIVLGVAAAIVLIALLVLAVRGGN